MSSTSTPATPAKESTGTEVKTFFEHVWAALKDHFGDAAKVEQAASIGLGVLAPLLNTLLTLTAGETIASKVAGVVATVQTELANAAALLSGAEAGDPSHTLDGFLSDVQTNLGTLLTDADVKNSTKATEITGVVNTLIGEVEAIQTATAGHVAPLVGTAATS